MQQHITDDDIVAIAGLFDFVGAVLLNKIHLWKHILVFLLNQIQLCKADVHQVVLPVLPDSLSRIVYLMSKSNADLQYFVIPFDLSQNRLGQSVVVAQRQKGLYPVFAQKGRPKFVSV